MALLGMKISKSEVRVFNAIKLAETSNVEWTTSTLAEQLKMTRANAHVLVGKLLSKGYLKQGHRTIVRADLITTDKQLDPSVQQAA